MRQRQTGSVLLMALLVTVVLVAIVSVIGWQTSRRLQLTRRQVLHQTLLSDQALALASVFSTMVTEQATEVLTHQRVMVAGRQLAWWVTAVPHCHRPLAKLATVTPSRRVRYWLITMVSEASGVRVSSQRCVSVTQDAQEWHWSVRWYHVGVDQSMQETTP